MKVVTKQPSLFTAIGIGVGCIIGSGWLFAAYYAARYAGSISLLAWVIGASLALLLALLLAEVSTMFKKSRGLFARLITLSHNRDYGFVIAISNWLGLVITIPSEAEATMQYLSGSVPSVEPYVFSQGHLTLLGISGVCLLILVYAVLNFWGIKTLAKANNIITSFKIIVPALTAVILIYTSFHPENFTAYKNSIAPYGVGHAFGAVVTAGIFYAFYGFGMIAIFGSELKNPQRNVPIALVSSVVLCLVIYLLLQVAFIGALPTEMIKQGWHHLDFTSPLAQLLILLNLNFWAVVLYIDSAVSPSGTAAVYTGSAARMFTGMAQDGQMPQFFDRLHPLYNLSRRSLALTVGFCLVMVLFFRDWQKIMIVVTAFQLLTCLAIPVSFTKLRFSQPNRERSFRMPFGLVISVLIYFLITYLLTQAGTTALLLSLGLHTTLFVIYSFSFYKGNIDRVILAFRSSWSIFLYLAFTAFFGYLHDQGGFHHASVLVIFFVLSLGLYWLLLTQKDAHILKEGELAQPATH